MCPHVHNSVEKSFVHVPIMGLHKIFPNNSLFNGSLRCDSREGQVMGDSIFLYLPPVRFDAGLVGYS